MQGDLGKLTGQPETVTAGDESHLFSPLDVEDLGAVEAWINTQVPDPLDVVERYIEKQKAKGTPLTVERQKFLTERAIIASSRSVLKLGMPDAAAILNSLDGFAFWMYLSIVKNEPDITLPSVKAFIQKMNAAAMAKATRATELDGVIGDPKAPTTDGTTNPSEGTTPSNGS